MKIRFAGPLFAIGLAAAALPAFSQDAPGPQPSDPARWYQPDVSANDHYRTAMKEAGAALNEAQQECRQLAQAERAACIREARERHRADVEAARARTQPGKAPQ